DNVVELREDDDSSAVTVGAEWRNGAEQDDVTPDVMDVDETSDRPVPSTKRKRAAKSSAAAKRQRTSKKDTKGKKKAQLADQPGELDAGFVEVNPTDAGRIPDEVRAAIDTTPLGNLVNSGEWDIVDTPYDNFCFFHGLILVAG